MFYPTLLNKFMSDLEVPSKTYITNYTYNIWEDENSYNLEVQVPGLTKTDIEVSIVDNILNIKGEKTVTQRDYSKKGYSSYVVNKSFTLPKDSDINNITASVENGILNVYISKAVVKTNEIKVKIK